MEIQEKFNSEPFCEIGVEQNIPPAQQYPEANDNYLIYSKYFEKNSIIDKAVGEVLKNKSLDLQNKVIYNENIKRKKFEIISKTEEIQMKDLMTPTKNQKADEIAKNEQNSDRNILFNFRNSEIKTKTKMGKNKIKNSKVDNPKSNFIAEKEIEIPSNSNKKNIENHSFLQKVFKKITQYRQPKNVDKQQKNKSKLSELLDIRNEKHKFPFGFVHFLKLILKWKDSQRSKQEKQFLNYKKQIEKDLDIIEVIKKLEEIDKLKIILFNPKQRYLFNLLSNPIIGIIEKETLKVEEQNMSEELSENNENTYQKSKNYIDYLKIKQYYHDLKMETIRPEINERIIQFIDNDILDYLDNKINTKS